MRITHKYLAKICAEAQSSKTYSAGNIQVLIQRVESYTVVAVRGTEFKTNSEGFKDFITNLFAWTVKDDVCGKVHKGALVAAKAASEELTKYISGGEIILTGHSLGGSIALLMYPILKAKGYNIKYCVTFGAPKVVTNKSKDLYKDLLITQYAMSGDVVPDFYGDWWNYVHINLLPIGPENKHKNWEDHHISQYITNL